MHLTRAHLTPQTAVDQHQQGANLTREAHHQDLKLHMIDRELRQVNLHHQDLAAGLVLQKVAEAQTHTAQTVAAQAQAHVLHDSLLLYYLAYYYRYIQTI
jgi:hypothetical protein